MICYFSRLVREYIILRLKSPGFIIDLLDTYGIEPGRLCHIFCDKEPRFWRSHPRDPFYKKKFYWHNVFNDIWNHFQFYWIKLLLNYKQCNLINIFFFLFLIFIHVICLLIISKILFLFTFLNFSKNAKIFIYHKFLQWIFIISPNV